jgi:membrane-bound lytic murein transglycosylase B
MNASRTRLVLLLSFGLGAACSGAAEVDRAAVEQARHAFIERMVTEHGFDEQRLAEILNQAEIDTRVLDAISRPAERVLTWPEYRALFLTQERIDKGVQFWQAHAEEIRALRERYGVDPRIVVAILGIETFFGERTGRDRGRDSLATLAFAYPPRASFFTSQLEEFLLLSREESVDPLQVLGSYAGAMGAGQFIPSSYRAYAVDADGDGRRDLWDSWDDVLGSVANYLSKHGWKEGEPVAQQVMPSQHPAAADPAGNTLELTETVASLNRMGYTFTTSLPGSAPATLLVFDGEQAPEYWVGYHNFRVITRYNRSAMYALAAHELGEAIVAALRERRGVQA